MEDDLFDAEKESNDIEIFLGDITTLEVDAIVNAAHEGLSGGGGVDGAIHRAAGQQMTGECLYCLYGCPAGKCRITGGYNLEANYIIHTVGPVWRGGEHNEENTLAECYHNCLMMAEMQGLKTIAFPNISTGAFLFPKDKAADIATDVVEEFLDSCDNKYIQKVIFVCFDEENYNIYRDIYDGSEENTT
jgi:O-acetyl-ADP-ribose deacetylase